MSFFSKKNIGDGNLFSIQHGRIRQGKLNSSYRLSWTESNLLVDAGKGEVVGKSFDFDQVRIFGFFFVALFLLLFARLTWLQVFNGDYFYKMAEGNRIRIERLESRRGVIYDRNMNPLVHNKANFLLYLVPSDLPKEQVQLESEINRLANIIAPLSPRQGLLDLPNGQDSLSVEQISQQIKEQIAKVKPRSLESFQPLFITDNIDYDKAMLLHLESANWNGVVLSNKIRREYSLAAQSFSHLLGYTSKINSEELKAAGTDYLPIDYIGKNGLEYFYESQLRGQNGKKQVEVDALGKVKKVLSSVESTDGSSLVLTIDLALQKKLEESLIEHLKKNGQTRASAIITDPNNGEILAMVSLPGYDNNIFARGATRDEYNGLINNPDRPLFNRAIAGEFPSGSVIKPVMAAAALQEGVVTEKTTFASGGGLRIGQWFFPDWKAGGHGTTDVKKALAESVNTYFYIIGGGYEDFRGLGIDRIVRYDRLFGLGEQTGIDLPGEMDGFVPTKEWKEETKKESWYIGDTYHLSIGQGDLIVTPLQVAQFTEYFANGGKIYQPHLVKEIINSDGSQEKIEPSVVKEKIIDDYNIDVVRRGMRQAVTAGSARSLLSLPVTSAGKTGTAQWSSKKANHAWFTGFAPYEDPKLVITVLVEEGVGGDVIAVPIAKDVLNWYFSSKTGTSTATSTPAQ